MSESTAGDVEPADIEAVAMALAAALAGVEDVDDAERFDRRLADSEWTARRTIDHLADALTLYSVYVASRATGRLQPLRDGRPTASLDELLGDVRHAAAILRRLLDAMDPTERAFHPAGPADRSGWAAMACDELIVHGVEIATAVGAPFTPDEEVVERVLRRLFPWAPHTGTAIERLLWANGRRRPRRQSAARPVVVLVVAAVARVGWSAASPIRPARLVRGADAMSNLPTSSSRPRVEAFCERFGLHVPILLAPMAGAARRRCRSPLRTRAASARAARC